MTLTKEEVLERFCKLSTKVMDERFKFMIAADCFCGENKCKFGDYRFDEQIMLFIEEAVATKLVDKKLKCICDSVPGYASSLCPVHGVKK